MIPFIKKSSTANNAEDIEDENSEMGFKNMIKKAAVSKALVSRAGMASQRMSRKKAEKILVRFFSSLKL